MSDADPLHPGDRVSTPEESRRHSVLVLWVIVALLPFVAAVVMGAIHGGYRCNIENDDTELTLMGVEFIVLPIAAATAGVLAGNETVGNHRRRHGEWSAPVHVRPARAATGAGPSRSVGAQSAIPSPQPPSMTISWPVM